ncbi:unnamed protein product [Rotaria sp. Silwood1]|nr:unnamed protein product [Rotaria sp. Silwood1]CAF4572060.1 unnamed protein product [Rotaria sp. Silwood1]CAF4572130.1 unnamed protein product [Rotaria sp. Silwood1]
MSNLSSFSSMATMLQTSNIVWQSVSLTDELKINLEYDIHRGLLNIFVKNTGNNDKLPCHINILSKCSEDDCKLTSNSNNNNDNSNYLMSPEILQDQTNVTSDNEINICYEISTTYVYDIIDENENTDQIDFSQTMISSSPSSSFYCDEQTIDNDDGYSTHSLDDIEQSQPQPQQQQSLAIPSSKLIVPSFSSSLYHHHHYYYSEQYVSPVRQLIEQLTWLSPFKQTVQKMMMNHMFE